eukprot:8936674-Ditylum_brightwellii.AAC.1
MESKFNAVDTVATLMGAFELGVNKEHKNDKVTRKKRRKKKKEGKIVPLKQESNQDNPEIVISIESSSDRESDADSDSSGLDVISIESSSDRESDDGSNSS